LARFRGEPDVWQRLSGPDEKKNPVIQWPKKLEQAEAMMAELRFPDLIPLLLDLLNEVKDLRDFQGNIVSANLPRTYGHLGFSYFQTGHAENAVEPMAKALELCQQYSDAQGTVSYLSNLFEAHRYLGQPDQAAAYAERLAEAVAQQGQDHEAAWFHTQTAIVRAGEPLVRLIAKTSTHRCELDQLAIQDGVRVDFEFYRNRINLQPARHWTAQAKTLWDQGKAQEALNALLVASKADPFDPHPWYQMGTIMLYAQANGHAVQSFKKAEELAPGWFHCRRYLWLARQLAEGQLDHGTFQTLQALDGRREDRAPIAKVALAREALTKTPQVAWLYLCLGGYLKALQQSQEAEAAFRRGLEQAAEPDVKSCLMLELALLLNPSSPERARLLAEVRQLNGNLNATAMAGVMLKNDAETKR
jgi:tetratricopeptide (TPR) repeat protein